MRQALITGASSNIGMAICQQYLSAGYRVIAQYRRDKSGLAQLAKKGGPKFVARKVDFADPSAVDTLLGAEWELFSATDVLINGAAARQQIPFAEISAATILHHLTINLIPGLLLMRRLGPVMVERGWGRIVHLGSIGVKFGGGEDSFCYSLTKHGMEFMPAIHREWAARNVFVNTLRVGLTETRSYGDMPKPILANRVALIPAGRMASPSEIAEAVFWLGSESNSWTTGQVIAVAGGE